MSRGDVVFEGLLLFLGLLVAICGGIVLAYIFGIWLWQTLMGR